MRGRGNNRKGPNPLTRSYESNGPDVKIRGTAQQIAEKYATLARDAQSSGDRVMAENYLQHAEHYNRLIAAAMAQVQPQNTMRDLRDDDLDDEEREEQESQGVPNGNNGNGNGRASAVNDGSGPQPVIEGVPAEVALNREMNGASGRGRGNGRGNGGNGAHRIANEQGAESRTDTGIQAEKPAPTPVVEAPAPIESQAAEAVAPEAGAEEAPAKARRPRRPRAKKADEATQAESTSPEGAAAQG